MMSAGVPAGASRPIQSDTFKSTPSSAKVGTLGNCLSRSPLVTAKALTRPLCKPVDAGPASAKVMVTSPVITAITDSLAPL